MRTNKIVQTSRIGCEPLVLTASSDPIRAHWEREMVQGYLDGRNADNPEPSGNRSRSYSHGFWNGRDDLAHSPRASASALLQLAEKAVDDDIAESRAPC